MDGSWCPWSVWSLLACKLPAGRVSALLCAALAPHTRVFATCDLTVSVNWKPVSAVYKRAGSAGWCVTMSFLFLSQRHASSSSHRRDRRKRLLGCGSRDPGCGSRLGGVWCRGEGIVNWFVSKWYWLLCVMKWPQVLVCPWPRVVWTCFPELFSSSIFIFKLSNLFLPKMFLLFLYHVGVNKETLEKLLKRLKTPVFICVSSGLTFTFCTEASSFSPTTFSSSWPRDLPRHRGLYATRWH